MKRVVALFLIWMLLSSPNVCAVDKERLLRMREQLAGCLPYLSEGKEEASLPEKSGTLSLRQGQYVVGKDMPAGRYDIALSSDALFACITIYNRTKKKIRHMLAFSQEQNLVADYSFGEGQHIEVLGNSLLLTPVV